MTDRRVLPLALHGIGIAVVAWAFVSGGFAARGGAWLAAACVVALASWAAVEVLQSPAESERRDARRMLLRRIVIVVGVLVTAYSQALTNGVLVAPLAIVLIVAVSDDREPVWVAPLLGGVALVLTPIGALAAGDTLPALVSYVVADVVWILIGVSRRQARVASRRIAELTAQQQATREQQARAALLADRQAAARDIHDVLAHSLGGLVIQLDAAEALLEAGRDAEGLATVTRARALAAEGLTDARRAVAALRSPDEAAPPAADLGTAVGRLIEAHRAMGAVADARIRLPRDPVPAATAVAFERAVQEALSNARRHAPGAPVDVELSAETGRLGLVVANAVVGGRRVGGPGGGNGLAGMAERFAALPGGSVTAGERDGRFVVAARADLPEER